MDTLEIICPYCGEEFSFQPGVTDGRVDLIEDCMICCQPVHVEVSIRAGYCEELVVNRG